MYGTVAKMKVKPGVVEKLKSLEENYSAETVKGYIGRYVYRMDNDPNELYMAVLFDSKESYRANAESPEQNERFQEMMQYLVAEPEWHDGEIVFNHQA